MAPALPRLLVALGLLALPLAAGLGPAAPAPPAPAPAAWVLARDGLARPAAPAPAFLDALAALPGLSPAGGTALLLDRAAALLAGAPGLRVPRAGGAGGGGFDGFGEADLQGDADGDGRSEVLLVIYDLGGGPADGEGGTVQHLRMVGAPDGRVLWELELEAVFLAWAPAVDLDGDGLTDVLALALVHHEPALAFPNGFVAQRFTWRLLALRGSDGGALWEHAQTFAYAYQGGGAFAGSVASPALFFLPVVGPDADGDGGLDVWLNALDAAELASPQGSGGARLDRFALLAGASGLPLGALALPAAQGIAIVLPSSDLTGDGRADSLATLLPLGLGAGGAGPGTLVLAAEGPVGTPRWHAAYEGLVAFALPFPDLDGDRAADPLVVVLDEAVRLDARSGADGGLLWGLADPLLVGYAAGDLDGDGAHDLVFMEGEVVTDGLAARVLGVAGATGQALYDARPFTVPLPADGYALIEFRPFAGDVDGDGAEDALLNAANGRFPEQFRGDVHLVRARDGADHLALHGQSYEGRPGGDLTGDGLADVLRLRAPPDGATEVAGVGTLGEVLWTRLAPAGLGVTVLGGADLGGGPAQDALALLVEPEAPSSGLEAWDGPGGALLWRSP